MKSQTRRRNGGSDLPVLWRDQQDAVKDNAISRRNLNIAAGLLLAILLLAAFVPIGGAVIGSGQVGAETRIKRIAHPTGGVIAEIVVSNGEHVEKGALLMRLDNSVTGADANYSNLTVEQLLAQRARLEAERLGAQTIAFPHELVGATNASAAKAMAEEQHLFAIKRQEQQQIQAQLEARIKQFNEQIRGSQAQISALQRQRTLIEPELRGVRELWDQQLVTINRVNQLERSAAEIEGNIASLNAQIAQTRARITETQEQSIQLGQTRRAEAGTELSRINTALNDQQLRNFTARDQKSRSDIRAPYAGTVEKLAFSAIGDVVRPAEAIMEIVPDRDSMVIETMVSPADIDQVRAKQTARVRFTSFNRPTTPDILGTVIYVATDRTENPESRTSYYMVRIAIDPSTLAHENLALRSGMPAEVYIQTGDRSLLSYVSKPLTDQFKRAFRDN